MTTGNTDFTRRQALSGLGGVSALALSGAALGGCVNTRGPDGAQGAPGQAGTPMALNGPDAKLDEIAYKMLAQEPGRATSLGVDTGEYASWRGTWGAPGETGREAYRSVLAGLVEEARRYPKEGLTSDQQIGFEVVETAFSSALADMTNTITATASATRWIRSVRPFGNPGTSRMP